MKEQYWLNIYIYIMRIINCLIQVKRLTNVGMLFSNVVLSTVLALAVWLKLTIYQDLDDTRS